MGNKYNSWDQDFSSSLDSHESC